VGTAKNDPRSGP